MPEWVVESSEEIEFEELPAELEVELVGGDLTVRAVEGPASLALHRVRGEPVRVSLEDGRLQIRQRPEHEARRHSWEEHSVSATVLVPAECHCQLQTVSATVVAQGLGTDLEVRTVSGEVVLDSVRGPVTAATVSGSLAARGLTGELQGKSVSGELSLEAFRGGTTRLGTVSGDVIVDLLEAPGEGSAQVDTTSGKVLVRLPADSSRRVRVKSVSGRLESAFPGLSQDRSPGRRQLRGSLGEGEGELEVTTVSGSVSLLAGAPD